MRLTETAWRNLDPWECCGQDNYCTRECHAKGGCTNGCIVPKLYKKLAAYEDAEVEQRIFIPPIKVGDLLYYIYYERVKGKWVIDDDPKQVNEIGTKYFFISSDRIDPEEPDDYYTYDMIGQRFFLTREEAEAAVAKLKEDQRHDKE